MDVSRSGRIRKKSTKLADSFTEEGESPGTSSGGGKGSRQGGYHIPEPPGEESPIEDLDDLQEADYDIKEEDFDQIPGKCWSRHKKVKKTFPFCSKA